MRAHVLFVFFYYLAVFLLAFVIVFPTLALIASSVRNWAISGEWGGWDFYFARRIFIQGWSVALLGALIFTVVDYGKDRGWWK